MQRRADGRTIDPTYVHSLGIFELFGEIVQNTLTAKKNAKQETIQLTIRPLARLGYFGTAGRVLLPKKAIVSTMQSTLRKTAPISSEML